MIRLHCDCVTEFVRSYVLERHVVAAVAVPFVFGLVFPFYWFAICPEIWRERPQLNHPKSWLVSYWLFASIVWFACLAICFARTRSETRMSLAGSSTNTSLSCRSKTDSTEDLWSEDRYFPDSYLPSPDYLVSVSTVQPQSSASEEKIANMDETWDYNYEEEDRKSQAKLLFPFEERPFHSLNGSKREGSSSGEGMEKVKPRKYSEPFEIMNSLRDGDDIRWKKGRKKTPSSSSSSVNRLSQRRPSPVYHQRKQLKYYYEGGRRQRPKSCYIGPYSSTNSELSSEQPTPTPSRRSKSMAYHSDKYKRPQRATRDSYPPPPLPLARTHRGAAVRRSPPKFRVRKDNISTTSDERLSSETDEERRRSPSSSSSADSRRVTVEQLQSAQAVAKGKIERKDSLVSDAKFDHILASLQSLATEIERDFVSADSTDEAN